MDTFEFKYAKLHTKTHHTAPRFPNDDDDNDNDEQFGQIIDHVSATAKKGKKFC